ncbi:MAG TPA: peptidase E [Streptosporangiaceae bacterium]|nr:peptidase E [Streptosporangiaceae bacterium]
MTARTPTILATSIGFRPAGHGQLDLQLGPAYAHAAALARAGDSPRVCIVGTALGDAADWLAPIYCAFGRAGWRASHLALFTEPNVPDIAEHLLAQDVVWVAGGSVANLLALWRLHGVGDAMRAAWQAGVVLMGVSAGSLCWFQGGTTDSFGLPLRPVTNGLGFLPYSNSPHHDAEEQRRPAIHRLIGEGVLPDGYATDNGTGLIFENTELVDCISEVDGASTWRITRRPDGTVEETALPTRLFPS